MVDALSAHLLSRSPCCNPSNHGDLHTVNRKPRFAVAMVSLVLMYSSATALAGSACENPDTAARQQASELDWVPLSQLTEAQRAALPTACCGAYITPARDDMDASADPAVSALRARADSSEARFQSDVVMHGNVQITQGFRSVRADTATYDQASRKIDISGNIQLREPGLLLRAERANVDIDHGNALLEDAQFVLHETRVRGTAKRLEKFGDRLFQLENSRFTSCEPGSNLWSVAGSQINIYPEQHYGTARHMRLNILNIPVLYAPYMRFPVGKERLTGFLYPSVGIDRSKGIDELEIPFYWNIAPNADMTITPRYLEVHGAILDTEIRHLSSHFKTQAELSYMQSDSGNYRQQDLALIERGLRADYTDEERWLLQVEQTGGKNQRWSTVIDYTDLSDTDYIRDVNGGALDENRQAFVTQMAAADYRSDHWLVGIKAEELRLLTEAQLPYRQLPHINAEGDYRFGDWQVDLLHEYTEFDVNSNYTEPTDTLIVGNRLRTDYQLTWDKESSWGFVKPAVAYNTLSYDLDERALAARSDSSPKLQMPQASIDSGLYFERANNSSRFLQTLEPRLFYLYREHRDHSDLYGITGNNLSVNFDTAPLTFSYDQLFRDTRFAGGDRLDDANQVSISLSNAWIEQTTGVERLRMSIGQIIYFDERKVGLAAVNDEELEDQENTSPIALQITGQLNAGLSFNSDLTYDDRTKKIDTISTSLRYLDQNYRIFNIGYRYTRDPVVLSPLNPTPQIGEELNQLDASVIWPVSTQWSVIARSNYDFHYDLELDSFAGLEYNDCCYRVRVMARRWLNFDYSADFLENVTHDDYRQGVFIDLQLKGLGSISERIGKLLDKAVVGYSERERAMR
jgi:LPS-assembly protein